MHQSNSLAVMEMVDGKYVLAADYEVLEARVKELEAALGSMRNDRDYHRNAALEQSVYWRNHYADRVTELEAAISAKPQSVS